ncbi:sialoadhesin-like [Pomacea canaliculata]|uniref:sialoadhesin-like n=1 Tax=Pomacea canaliculata TaxID=400727 RepID=UPI000D7370C1|nr:sialoadhesin-like [Pomacea canaliculata]
MSKKAWILSIFQPLLQLLLLLLHSASTAPATPFVQSSSGLSSTYFGVAVTLTCNVTQTSSSLMYSWKLNSSTVQTAASSNTYLVDGDEADSGSYVCVVEDGTGSASSSHSSLQYHPSQQHPSSHTAR